MIFFVPEFIIKPLLFLTHFLPEKYCVILCLGYNDDFENYTALYWQDDKENYVDYSDYILRVEVPHNPSHT